MKKVTLITLDKEAESTVQVLRQLGVLHVQHEQLPKGEDITILQEKLSLVESALAVLSVKEFSLEVATEKTKPLTDWVFTPLESPALLEKSFLTGFTAKHIIDLRKRIEQLEEFAATLSSRINQQENWGDFSPEAIEELSQKNIFIRLYQIPPKEMQLIPKNVVVKKLFSAGGIVNCVIISYGKVEISFKETPLPKMGLEKLRKRLTEDKKVMQSLKEELVKLAGYREEFLKIKRSLESELEFHQAIRGMGQSGTLTYITGYMPFDKVESVTQMAKKEKWGLLIRQPSEEDNVPVLIRNPKWISLINPVYKLMEVVPGYHELDVSPLFLLFLALFFGMIIGDAGYGVVYFMLTFLAQRRYSAKVKDKTIFSLFYLFSSCAIIWGLLTGTLFGQQWYLAKGFKALAPALNNTKFLMAFCFLLGTIQLSLAHGWQALKKLPSLTALADLGFICLLWTGFLLAKMFILGDPFPVAGKWLVWVGVSLIILFTSPQKNFLKTVASGLGTLALGAIGNFGDVVSYIRLFAVGLASVAVADSVNTLAAAVGANIAGRVLILFVGHTINIVIGPMSVLVHGIRLNVLEFSLLHANVTWSGLAYKPLREG